MARPVFRYTRFLALQSHARRFVWRIQGCNFLPGHESMFKDFRGEDGLFFFTFSSHRPLAIAVPSLLKILALSSASA